MTQTAESNDTAQVLIDFIARELIDGDDGDLDVDDDLLGSGLVDSLGVMRLVRFVEESFETTVPAADVTLENFMTVRAITTYLETQREKGTHG